MTVPWNLLGSKQKQKPELTSKTANKVVIKVPPPSDFNIYSNQFVGCGLAWSGGGLTEVLVGSGVVGCGCPRFGRGRVVVGAVAVEVWLRFRNGRQWFCRGSIVVTEVWK